ncbi:T9SS type A sorting domain-containing protein [Olleya sp. YS]|uniref:T9SS type A sorting domain-containing protein n=1 Tax=Olleya sp. YS TaxID=3028318 RepID=UPI0024344F42|nr:T9SS type A sorting domain-containing protein [Olleya sp. YS]WGD35195.1 T9SS type A sorting domain-containing protein [Olleya sp. YS]
MKKEITFRLPKSTILFLFTLFFSFQSYANDDLVCGHINNIEFSNGNEITTLENGGNYSIGDLPSNFYLSLNVSGYSQSAKYRVTNLDTGEVINIIENQLPYTFPAGNTAWNLGVGNFEVKAKLYKFNYAFGFKCDEEVVTFSLSDNTCDANAGTMSADASPVTLVNGTATISATPNGDALVPAGYSNIYVLTQGDGLVIVNAGGTPSFDVTEAGDYTIHSLVYDPNTLDLSIVVPGQTTGFDVNGLLLQGGGMICASLDVAGAPIMVETCDANAGTMSADASPVTLVNGTATISATPNGDAIVPAGYSNIYVLTQGDGLVIVNAGGTPSFDVTEAGDYTIHSLVYDPNTLDLSIVVPGQTTGFDVNGLLLQGGGMICASLDVAGAPIMVETCDANAGTMSADASPVTLLNGTATISATPNGDAIVPAGYSNIYVLTQGDGLVIVNAGGTPSFDVTEAGDYTIHSLVYDPNTLDLSIVVPGQTTGFDVNGLLLQGGGMICASLDVAGAPIMVETCDANAGTMSADASPVTLVNGTATISATPNGDAIVPAGYSNIYVLTQGDGLVIVNAGGTPSFDVTEAGDYTIHSLVYDPNTLDLSIVVPGQTTGFDVNGLLLQGGGMICASLDVAGAPIMVETCDANAGTMSADASPVTLLNGTATISATPNGDAIVPAGYSNIYVLTQGDGLVIVNAGGTPSFDVTEAGDYTIHSLVYDPNTLDLSIVVPGQTTGFDVNGLLLQGGGMICASLDVAGAPIMVETCDANAGTMSADASPVTLVNGTATISATPNGDAIVPAGYSNIYVLTQGDGLVIVNAGGTPSFDVTEAGDYTIHSLVYDPNTLDLSIVVPGQTTGFDVNGLLLQGGGMICASLDVAGAPIMVETCDANAGTMSADASPVTLVNGTATISATPNGDAIVPAGYSNIYVLTQGDGLVIVNAGGTPSFDVTEAGDYTIHSLVYDPNTLDLSIVVPGQTTGFDVNGLLLQGGGMICASLDVAGAPIMVEESQQCNAQAAVMYSQSPINCLSGGTANLTATVFQDAVVPNGYSEIFVLTNAFGLTVLDVSATPSFDISTTGFYRIHSLVYDPNTLDLSVVVPGTTTGFDVINLINDNNICASLNPNGAINIVINNTWFCNFISNFFNNNRVDISEYLNTAVLEFDSYEAFKNSFTEANANTDIKLFPNPVISELNIDIQVFDDEIMNYTINDASGRQVMSGILNTNGGTSVINTNALSSGMYLISLESEYRTITKKIVVNK